MAIWCALFKQYFKSWRIQNKLLQNANKPFVSVKNDMLWYVIFQIAYLMAVLLIFGGLWFELDLLVALLPPKDVFCESCKLG